MASIADRLSPRPVAVFSLLTLFIWTNRIWLAWTNAEDSVGEKLLWSTPITIFWVSAIVLLGLQWTGRSSTDLFRRITTVFAVGTIGYWILRLTIIVLGDWAVGFKVVHAVLAIASSVAAWFALRSLHGRSADPALAEDSQPPLVRR